MRDGAYPTVEDAVEAAVAHLEHPDFEGLDLEALDASGRRSSDEGLRAATRS